MRFTRQGREFWVVDDPQTRAWNFWEDQFASEAWEPETLRVIEETLKPEHTYIDLGAWVGPTSLWAAEFCKQVFAVEPDPEAYSVLLRNCCGPSYRIVNAAVSRDRGGALLKTRGAWGDSMSTIVGGIGGSVDEIPVATVTFDDVVSMVDVTTVGLVKIDIEGAEGEVIPSAARTLKALHCPIILALHKPWLADPDGLLSLINDLFVITVLEAHDSFPTLLLEP